MDQSIYEDYKFWPNNYIAYDLLYKTDKYKSSYTEEDKKIFLNYKDKQLDSIKENSENANN